jgi:ABC-type multidrug transport system fused ATPase/permease subunit
MSLRAPAGPPRPVPHPLPRPAEPGALPRPLAGNRRLLFATLVAVGVTLAGLTVAWSVLVGSIIGRLSDPAATPGAAVAATAAQLCALALVTATLVGLERVLAEQLGQRWVNEVRVTVFEHLSRTPVRDDRRSTGGTTLRLVGDMTALRRWASLGLARLAVAVPMVLGCLVALLVAAPAIAAAVAAVVAIGVATTRAVSPRLDETNRVARRRRTRVAAHVTEHVSNRLVMQAFGREAAERRRLRLHGRRLGRAMVHRARMIGLVRAIGEATALLAAAAALVAALAVRVDAAAAGAALAVVAVLATALRDLSRVAEYRAAMCVAREKLVTVLRRPVRPQSRVTVGLRAGHGLLEAEDVGVDGVFAGIGLRAAPGTVTAVIGPNGSGKSTLLTVLAGLLRPDTGRVLLDGIDLRVLDQRQLRAAIGLAGPDLPLLRGTVGENVRYAAPGASDADVAAALRDAGLDEVLDALPDGLDTRIGEGGAGLSAGQRQRVALARAVLARPRVLLLDEADAHLDPRAAVAVDRLVAGFAGAAVVVTHRPERLATADAVYELSGGVLHRTA